MMRFLQLLLLTASCLASAGVRIIHGGGGYAEMKALTALDRLQTLVLPCTLRPDLCPLSPAQTAFLAEAWPYLESKRARLAFVPDGADFAFDPGDDLRLIMSSNPLYAGHDVPMPFSFIAARVFTAWASRPALAPLRKKFAVDAAGLDDMAARIFTSTWVEESSAAARGLKVHTMTFHSVGSSYSEVLVSLEAEDKTTPLTPALLAALPCAPPKERRLTAWVGLHISGGVAQARAEWQCGDTFHRGRIAFSAADLASALTSIHASGVTAMPCHDALKESQR